MLTALPIPLNIILLATIIMPLVFLFILDDEDVVNMLRTLNYLSLLNLFVLAAIPLFTSEKRLLGEHVSWLDILTYAPIALYLSIESAGITLQEFLSGEEEDEDEI